MRRQNDPTAVLERVHENATGSLLHLVDGFYFNIEDGLFELAYRSEDETQRRRCFDLMRELRFRRKALIRQFASSMRKLAKGWMESGVSVNGTDVPEELKKVTQRMAEKSRSHFAGVLAMIAERVEVATGRKIQPTEMPVSPGAISAAFVLSCRSLKFDAASIDIVQDLFSRFVLDRLGSIYGECNQALETAGYIVIDLELELALEVEKTA